MLRACRCYQHLVRYVLAGLQYLIFIYHNIWHHSVIKELQKLNVTQDAGNWKYQPDLTGVNAGSNGNWTTILILPGIYIHTERVAHAKR